MRLGVDLGGTKIEIVALDDQGHERWRARVPTPQGDYAATLGAIAALVREAEEHVRVPPGSCSIGIGTPGSLSRVTGRLRNSNSVCLNDQPIVADLERRLQRPVRDRQRCELLCPVGGERWCRAAGARSCSA